MTLKRFLALLLAAVLLGGVPALADADEAPLPEGLFELGEASEYGDIAIEEDTVQTTPSASAPMLFSARSMLRSSGASTSYDPRESGGWLTPVRAQGSFNTCWAVASMGAAEVNGLKRGLLATSAQTTDLSERHLIYFFSHQADDPLGNSSQDYNVSPSFWIQNGGNPIIATMALAGWHGAADEAATNSPYSGLSTNDSLDAGYAYTDVLHLENTYVLDLSTDSGRAALKSMIREHGGAVLCLYYSSSYLFAGSPSAQSEDPDPADAPILDVEDETFDGSAEEETFPTDEPTAEDSEPETLPEVPEAPSAEDPVDSVPAETPADADSDAEAVPEPELPEAEPEPVGETAGLDGVPEGEEELWIDGSDADDFTVCYYQNSVTTTNHEVLVVGWDDDYPAENFSYSPEGAAPAQNGAWLCRNSYGSSWYGGDGYFWVSYYDVSAAAPTGGSISGRATVFEFGASDNYDNNYEYDGAAILGYVNDSVNGKGISTANAGASTQRWYANVFTACGNDAPRSTESLRAVSTFTYRADVAYTVQVYTGLTDPADPTSGTPAAEISGTFPYAGYHTVVLPSAVPLQEGEAFSVVFRVGAASDNSVYVPACYTSSNWHSTNETLSGQSFVSLTGSEWLDCKDLKNEPNVRIKAFTDNVSAVFPFTDVSDTAWYYDDVRESWLKYLVNGTSATAYEPDLDATRAQVVTVLWRLAGEPAPDGAAGFPDVAADAWYADAVAWAAENGIVYGYSDGIFRPNLAITRQEFIAVLYRYAQLRGMDTSAQADISAYPDTMNIGVWAKPAIRWSFASGVMQGVETADGGITVSPLTSVTRAQLAAFLNRFSDMSE